MDDKLEYIFKNVNEWLKFIETKNAGVLTLSVALIVCALQFLKGAKEYEEFVPIIIYFLLVFICTLFMSMYSLVAKMTYTLNADKNREKYKKNCNLLFYGNLAKFTVDNLLIEMYDRYNNSTKKVGYTIYQSDLANQIIINSCIAVKKGAIFNFSIKFLLINVIIGITITCFVS